jgi:hypothetical protein
MKRFVAGFVIGLVAFGFANVVSHFASSSPVGRTDRVLYFGFPFAVWVEGGLPRIEGEISYLGLLGDIAIAALSGTVVGVLFLRSAKHGVDS